MANSGELLINIVGTREPKALRPGLKGTSTANHRIFIITGFRKAA